MAYPKGKPRPEGSGRKKGTPNGSTIELIKTLHSLDYNPARELVELGVLSRQQFHNAEKRVDEYYEERQWESGTKPPPAPDPIFLGIAKDIAKALNEHVYPKRKAIDMTSDGQGFNTLFDIFKSVANEPESEEEDNTSEA